MKAKNIKSKAMLRMKICGEWMKIIKVRMKRYSMKFIVGGVLIHTAIAFHSMSEGCLNAGLFIIRRTRF